MSWSVNVPPGPVVDFSERAGEAKLTVAGQFELQEAQEAFDAAVEVVYSLAAALGAADQDHISVQLSGHANKDHQPPEGWSPDTVYVNVVRVRAPA